MDTGWLEHVHAIAPIDCGPCRHRVCCYTIQAVKPGANRIQHTAMLRIILFLTAFLPIPALAAPSFQSGRPVWPEGRETEMNLTAGFRAVFCIAPP